MTKTMRGTALAVLLSFSSSFIAAPASAAIVSTEEAVAMHQDRSELKQFFDREDIVNALQAHGVSAEMAKARVDSMTEEEAQKLAAHIENAPAGAGIVGTLFAVFIILLVTDILGLTKVFPFTRSVR
ncbi:MAG TPA: PA2779 family protein [Limnobacter sp.]|nr:PA2779 family protein [Limnobacter sp.]